MRRAVYTFYFVSVVPILALGIPHFIGSISRAKHERLIILIWALGERTFLHLLFPCGTMRLLRDTPIPRLEPPVTGDWSAHCLRKWIAPDQLGFTAEKCKLKSA